MSEAVAPATWLKEAKKNAGWIIALGVVQIIVGMLALGSPLVAGIAVAVVAGVFLSSAGIIRIFAAFKDIAFIGENNGGQVCDTRPDIK